jgi:hypothetical protein
VTLREAEAATGIPTNTLRKWVRKDELASYLESDGDLALRMVDLKDVKRRADTLGRAIAPKDIAPPPETDDAAARHSPDTFEPDAPPETMPEETMPEETMPEETMIVPIDAWNKILNQLGNLHEAGQQLAEAKERAAKAETEAVFLRDRLAELRVESQTVAVAEPKVEETATPAPIETPRAERSTSYWRYLTTGWRNRNK